MGTENGVNIEQFSIIWGKNEFFIDCAMLFVDDSNREQLEKWNPERHELESDVDSEENNDPVLNVKVSLIKTRLDLMGYTLNHCKK